MEGRKILQWGLSGLGVAIVLGYSYFMIDDFIRGPRLIIDSPQSGFSTTSPLAIVSGRGIHTNNVAINDSPVAVDLEGNFHNQLILAPGYNIIKVTAKDNYDRIETKTIEVVLVVPEVSIATSTVASTSPEIISDINNF